MSLGGTGWLHYPHTKLEFPFAVISDLHCHDWSAYSYTNEFGVNNRLQDILDEVNRAADILLKSGGNDLIITGDLFHTRGKIKPSVFNSVSWLFEGLTTLGIRIHMIPGNHDLEGKHSTEISNAMHSLGSIEHVYVYSYPSIVNEQFLFIPWNEDFSKVLHMANAKALTKKNLTLFCHVGMNNVIPGYLGDTINPYDFSEDLKYVFSGHFHNHASFNSRVYSVGALTHQTWGDVGSKAGFLIVYEDKVEHYESEAPKFVEWSTGVSVKNNYVRIKGEYTQELAEAMINAAKVHDALIVVDQSTRPTLKKKEHKYSIDVDLGVDNAIAAYCANNFGDKAKRILKICLDSMN